MATIYFIADTHFSDETIIKYENRPFQSVSEMNSKIIHQWNTTVEKNDIVYILGDFGADKNEFSILNQLNGEKYLVKGNHDIYSNAYYRHAGFTEVYDMPVIFNEFWILSHKPLYVNNNMPYANIFGHVHNSPIFRTYNNQHYCVSVERIHYTPISMDEIREKIQSQNYYENT